MVIWDFEFHQIEVLLQPQKESQIYSVSWIVRLKIDSQFHSTIAEIIFMSYY